MNNSKVAFNEKVAFAIITELGILFKLIEPNLTVEQLQEFATKFLFYSINDVLESENVKLDFVFKGESKEDWHTLFSFLNSNVNNFTDRLYKILVNNVKEYMQFVRENTDEKEIERIEKRMNIAIENILKVMNN